MTLFHRLTKGLSVCYCWDVSVYLNHELQPQANRTADRPYVGASPGRVLWSIGLDLRIQFVVLD